MTAIDAPLIVFAPPCPAIQELGHHAGFWTLFWTYFLGCIEASIDPDKVERNQNL
jgi:hypothetical protein